MRPTHRHALCLHMTPGAFNTTEERKKRSAIHLPEARALCARVSPPMKYPSRARIHRNNNRAAVTYMLANVIYIQMRTASHIRARCMPYIFPPACRALLCNIPRVGKSRRRVEQWPPIPGLSNNRIINDPRNNTFAPTVASEPSILKK